MEAITIILYVMVLYLFQVWICAIINLINGTRFPISVFDFIKLTFLPYVIINLNKIKG